MKTTTTVRCLYQLKFIKLFLWTQCIFQMGPGNYHVFWTHNSLGWQHGFPHQGHHNSTKQNFCRRHSGIPGCHPQAAVCHGEHKCHFWDAVIISVHAHLKYTMTCGAIYWRSWPRSCHKIYSPSRIPISLHLEQLHHPGTPCNGISVPWAAGWSTSKMRPGSLSMTLTRSLRASSASMFQICSWK